MPISVSCESCGANLKAKDEHAGKKIRCPKCKEAIAVPKRDRNDDDLMFDDLLEGERTGEELDEDELPPRRPPQRAKPEPKKKPKPSRGSSGNSKAAVFSGVGGGVAVVAFIIIRVGLVLLRSQGFFAGEVPGFFNKVIAVQNKAVGEFNKVVEAISNAVEQDSPDLTAAEQALQKALTAKPQYEGELNAISAPSAAKQADELVAAVRNQIQVESDVLAANLPKIRAIMQDRSVSTGARMRNFINLCNEARKIEDPASRRMISAQRAYFSWNNITVPANIEREMRDAELALSQPMTDPWMIPDGPLTAGGPRMPRFGGPMGGPTMPGGPPMGPPTSPPMGPNGPNGPMGPPGGMPGGPMGPPNAGGPPNFGGPPNMGGPPNGGGPPNMGGPPGGVRGPNMPRGPQGPGPRPPGPF